MYDVVIDSIHRQLTAIEKVLNELKSKDSVNYFPLVDTLKLDSVFIGILGGIISGLISGVVNFEDFVYGLHFSFNPYYVTYSIVKTLFFAFIFTSIPAFYGYYVQGGAREVGKAGTKAVVDSSIAILTANLVLTQIML
jgi:phospholipid/cholesterol/gamma-HCH transport system permease protein